ncbi:TetR/AcrR family transcriptional regulator C-terminal domain-containing protein [Jiangella rhizosphaerae]|uniref:TetR family transcriptional regulator n=1 Tax=Jiangella rhizosphaerae TaxID=2293569 RepID=A0A418KQ94_9ACTN|nr:TetR/AcrR family transcriptional regulator C-terminal domain-containing protein [Jiangella rhizosphaerae]RIQ22315.1 TetR family transcriptional regulator [Jiangella rhizosphaerae]
MGRSRVQGKHAGLTREQVLEAAVRLADRDGVEALSMRKLARELDVEAMTLYHHVQNKQGLEDAIVEHVLAESLGWPPESGAWQEVVAGYAHDLHRGLARHPGAVLLFATRPAITPRSLAILETLVRLLREAGFPARTALHLVYAVAGAVVGLHLGYAGDQNREPAAVADLAGEDLPVLADALADGPVTMESRLDFTLTALIAGFETLLPADGRRLSPR